MHCSPLTIVCIGSRKQLIIFCVSQAVDPVKLKLITILEHSGWWDYFKITWRLSDQPIEGITFFVPHVLDKNSWLFLSAGCPEATVKVSFLGEMYLNMP